MICCGKSGVFRSIDSKENYIGKYEKLDLENKKKAESAYFQVAFKYPSSMKCYEIPSAEKDHFTIEKSDNLAILKLR